MGMKEKIARPGGLAGTKSPKQLIAKATNLLARAKNCFVSAMETTFGGVRNAQAAA